MTEKHLLGSVIPIHGSREKEIADFFNQITGKQKPNQNNLKKLMSKYTKIIQWDANTYNVWFKVENQSFCVTRIPVTKDEAKQTQKNLAEALMKIIKAE